jgi:predicted GTPase
MRVGSLAVKWLRRHVSEVPVLLVANKCEGMHTHAMYGHEDAASLGCGAALPISAETSMGLAELYTALQRWIPGSASSHVRHTTRGARRRVEHVAAAAVRDWDREEGDTEEEEEEEEEEDGERAAMQLAIVGRPNAGKSTLVNRLLGHERVLTGPERGLTRDSIRLPMQHEGRPVWLVDTAGWEKKVTLKVGGSLKALPGEQAKRALNRAHVVAVLLDGRDYLDHGRLLRSEVRERERERESERGRESSTARMWWPCCWTDVTTSTTVACCAPR